MVLVTPTTSPKMSQERSLSAEQQIQKDTITLSAVSSYDCTCGSKNQRKQDKKSGSNDIKIYQPTPFCNKSSDKE